ncbi:hypothetical protein BGZ96_000049 [Linnemannia gamsii]|uniref:UPF3 domain-containing protein n=1 Tax=Linnemannia gamsii TaxID=64522 RepID=A0ABQ7KK04_9FUNG|nr:hypothetical protein BGZ96_000020 [Linnemannia gamsii]KAG0299046.1 hypothetical protein BGZ96_000049 [Linnemannia gamsii]
MSTKPAPSKRSARTKGPNRGQAKSKIVVRRLPANLPEHVFLDSIKGLVLDSALDRPTTWVPGKVSKNPVKANTFARAYIYFKNEKLALEFQKAYHGHTFLDRHGNEGKAHVEFAPFQKIPREQRKADTKQGTIEEDPDYIAFLQSLTADPTDAEKEMKLSGTEQLLKESAINPKSTPLLEALRAQKAAAQAKAQAAKLAARQARQSGKAGISNAGKVQITILSNRNAKDAANKAGTTPSANSAASTSNKPQLTQGKKATHAPEPESTQGAKPKRERKRRDRASKRAGSEASSTGNTAQQQGDSAPPQITLLKSKNAQGSQPSNSAAQSSGHQEARPQPAQNQSNQGGSNPGGRRGHQNQGNNNSNTSNNNNSISGNAAQTGNVGSGGSAKKDAAQSANAEGGQGRSGRSRRNRGDRAKQDSKAGGDNVAGSNPNVNANSNSVPITSSSTNTNSGSNAGNKPEGQSGGGRSGRNRRGRGGGQESSTTAAAQS